MDSASLDSPDEYEGSNQTGPDGTHLRSASSSSFKPPSMKRRRTEDDDETVNEAIHNPQTPSRVSAHSVAHTSVHTPSRVPAHLVAHTSVHTPSHTSWAPHIPPISDVFSPSSGLDLPPIWQTHANPSWEPASDNFSSHREILTPPCRRFPLEDVQEACLMRYYVEEIAHWVITPLSLH